MQGSLPLERLVSEWSSHLEQRCHRVRRPRRAANVVVSRNGHGTRYRWVLLHARGPSRRLTAIEHETIKRELERGRRAKEQVYLVMEFERPENKLVVLPAIKAAELGQLRSDKGGIPWNR